MNWFISAAIYLFCTIAVVWTTLRHALPGKGYLRYLVAAGLAVLCIGLGSSGTFKQYRKEHPKESSVATPKPTVVPSAPPLTTDLAGITGGQSTPPISKPKINHHHAKPTAPVGHIHGDDNTIVGHSEYGSVDGSGNTIVGTTHANGNTIFNRGGTAIGHGATADPTSIAIGAGAHAGDTGPAITQTMTNSPGGMQAGHDLTVIGKIPAPDRILLPNDEDTAINLLKTVAPGKMAYFIKIPTDSPENGEISRFQKSLGDVFARGGWVSWQDRETHFGSYTTMGEGYSSHGEGIGCTPAKGHEKEAAVAMKALEILKHPCRGRSANDLESYPQHGDFVIYISVGTRLAREE